MQALNVHLVQQPHYLQRTRQQGRVTPTGWRGDLMDAINAFNLLTDKSVSCYCYCCSHFSLSIKLNHRALPTLAIKKKICFTCDKRWLWLSSHLNLVTTWSLFIPLWFYRVSRLAQSGHWVKRETQIPKLGSVCSVGLDWGGVQHEEESKSLDTTWSTDQQVSGPGRRIWLQALNMICIQIKWEEKWAQGKVQRRSCKIL